MTSESRASIPGSSPRPLDWERFFRDYRQPDFIPGYSILNKLGSGVFGEVYKAKKVSIGKLYAIKFLRLQDDQIAEQVLRELQAVDHFAQVDHPNLVSIEDRGEVGGIPYIVMGYAGEETLKVVLKEQPLSRDRALDLFRQVVTGVQALHQHAIIHFDLKPANIFIKGNVARVGDYGLSKLMSESRATLSMGRGTPHYMAPEMLQRRGDARSDVYSLGVILFEMLTGDVPFRGESEWEILRRHESELPVIPESLGPHFRHLLGRCLAKNPDGRFAHAGALLSGLDSAVNGGREPEADAFLPPASTPPSRPSESPPLLGDLAARSAALGARAGRFLGRRQFTLTQFGEEIHDLLQRVRRDTVTAYRESRKEIMPPPAAITPAPAEKPERSLSAPERPPTGRWSISRAIGSTVRILTFPVVQLSRWLTKIAVWLLIPAAMCFAVHLGLRTMLL